MGGVSWAPAARDTPGYRAPQSAPRGASEPAASTVAGVSTAASVTGARATASAPPAGPGTSVRAVSGPHRGLGCRGHRGGPTGPVSGWPQPRSGVEGPVRWSLGKWEQGLPSELPGVPWERGGGHVALLVPGSLCLVSPTAACAEGTFGARCEERCACRRGAPCHHVTGACLCPPGWRGLRCENGETLGPAGTLGWDSSWRGDPSGCPRAPHHPRTGFLQSVRVAGSERPVPSAAGARPTPPATTSLGSVAAHQAPRGPAVIRVGDPTQGAEPLVTEAHGPRAAPDSSTRGQDGPQPAPLRGELWTEVPTGLSSGGAAHPRAGGGRPGRQARPPASGTCPVPAGCPPGLFGPGCEEPCGCPDGASCDAATGACLCPAGFLGADCSLREWLGREDVAAPWASGVGAQPAWGEDSPLTICLPDSPTALGPRLG